MSRRKEIRCLASSLPALAEDTFWGGTKSHLVLSDLLQQIRVLDLAPHNRHTPLRLKQPIVWRAGPGSGSPACISKLLMRSAEHTRHVSQYPVVAAVTVTPGKLNEVSELSEKFQASRFLLSIESLWSALHEF